MNTVCAPPHEMCRTEMAPGIAGIITGSVLFSISPSPSCPHEFHPKEYISPSAWTSQRSAHSKQAQPLSTTEWPDPNDTETILALSKVSILVNSIRSASSPKPRRPSTPQPKVYTAPDSIDVRAKLEENAT